MNQRIDNNSFRRVFVLNLQQRLTLNWSKHLWQANSNNKQDSKMKTVDIWESLCLPVEKEGLGCKFLLIMNKALIAKWLWRYEKRTTTYGGEL